MRLHFYTGIAMSAIAADYASAVSTEGETSLDTISTAESSWVAPLELSQVDSEDVMKAVAKGAAKSAGNVAKGAADATKAAAKAATKPAKKTVVKK